MTKIRVNPADKSVFEAAKAADPNAVICIFRLIYHFCDTSYSEVADVFELAVNDVIAKYGDTYELYLTNMFTSLDEMLAYMRRADFIDQYNFKAQLKWNVNDHAAIFVTIYSLDVEIEYRSIESTGGTGFNEDSLI